jgi:hypothetical protein
MLPALSLEAGYHDTFASRSSLWTEATDRSDFASVVTGSNQFDWYRNRRFFAMATVEVLRSELGLRLNREQHRSYFVAGVASALGEPADRVNPSIEDGLLTSIGARLSVGETILAGVTGGNHLVLYAEHSGLLGGDFRFTQLSGILDLRAETFARRRFIPNTLDVRIAAGASLGDLPIQRTSLIDGSAAFLAPVYFSRFGSLRTLQHRAYQGDRHAGVFWEHSFRSLPFELMGWRWAARQGYGIIVHGAHARTWLSQRLKDEIGYPGAAPDSFHHEIGISLTGVFGLFRIDATQRIDKPGFTLGIGVARIL